MIVRELKQRLIRFGEKDHAGWLPPNSARPLPTLQRTVAVDFRIRQDAGSSFSLEWDGPDRETTGDTWHPDLPGALEQARLWFGIDLDEWQVPS